MTKIKLILIITISFCITHLAFANSYRNNFTDEHLTALLHSSEKNQFSGIIYTWSPRMNLSLIGVQELVEIAKNYSLYLVILLDPNITDQEADNLIKPFDEKNLNSYRFQSNQLASTNLLIHFPSLILFKNGQLLNPSRPGYDQPERLESYLLEKLK